MGWGVVFITESAYRGMVGCFLDEASQREGLGDGLGHGDRIEKGRGMGWGTVIASRRAGG